MVFVYTANLQSGNRQNQRISTITYYTTFHYYQGNRVLDIGQTSNFRDPDVFWDKQSARWIMNVALCEQRQINYYASKDLKHWDFISSFGAGAYAQIWEVPLLFQLPVDGNANDKKWIQVCGMGPNKVQYFVGNFDGSSFTMDPRSAAYLLDGAGLEGEVFADFQGTDYGGWTATGTAFGSGPAGGLLPAQQKVTGHLAAQLATSFPAANNSTVSLPST